MSNDLRNRAFAAVTDFGDEPLSHFISGAAVSGEGQAFDVFEPATGDVLGQARDATAGEVDHAVEAARAAFAEWAATPGTTRRKILHNVADLIVERAIEKGRS